MENVLKQICEDKLKEIEAAKQLVSAQEMLDAAKKHPHAPKGFINAIQQVNAEGKPALIAEVKKKSPSKGIIREDFNHIEIAKAYEKGGATCLSVLTDEKYFDGKNQYLIDIATITSLPTLRKDFILDPYQIHQAKILGADCILLIIAALDRVKAEELEATAMELGLDVLVEVHEKEELDVALQLKSKLIGVNNRSLKTFETSLDIGKELVKHIPSDYIKVCESGIYTNDEIKDMMQHGYNAFLVGESLMREANVEEATKKLLGN